MSNNGRSKYGFARYFHSVDECIVQIECYLELKLTVVHNVQNTF